MRRVGTVRRAVNGRAVGRTLQSWGLTLLEVLISLGILSLFLLGGPQVPPKAGLVLYVTSLKQQAKAREIVTAAWLAKGKLESLGVTAWEGSDSGTGRYDDQMLESQGGQEGTFPPPHGGYSYGVAEGETLRDRSFRVVTLTVTGPTGGRVTLHVLK